jgi:hypothetical protein
MQTGTGRDLQARRPALTAVGGVLLVLTGRFPALACADLLDVINRARAACGAPAALRGEQRLTEVARLRSLGVSLAGATQQAGYPAVHILVTQLAGVPDERSLGRMLTGQLCARLAADGISEAGA